jgi:hydrogenase/urease accessory protein HupE
MLCSAARRLRLKAKRSTAHHNEAARGLGLSNGFWGPVQSLDLGHLGYGMVAVSIVIWAGAAIVWKKRIQPKERT